MQSITADQRATEVELTDLIHGECLCGEIAFEFRESHQHGRDRAMGTCHCTRCQRWSGSSSVPFVVASPQQFRVTKGQELMAHYRSEGTSVRTFCRRCGSSLYTDAGHDLLRERRGTPGPGPHTRVPHPRRAQSELARDRRRRTAIRRAADRCAAWPARAPPRQRCGPALTRQHSARPHAISEQKKTPHFAGLP